jgi:hypothetical protein
LIVLSIAYAQLFEASVSLLFLPPPASVYITSRLLTYAFQLLCAIPPLVCLFTFGVIQQINPNLNNNYILVSGLFTGGFWLNEIYRIHIFLIQFHISKISTIFIYGTIVILYFVYFWRKIAITPYQILFAGMGLLFLAIAIDSLHLNKTTINTLLEGIPKLLSGLNIAYYYWYICKKELLSLLDR